VTTSEAPMKKIFDPCEKEEETKKIEPITSNWSDDRSCDKCEYYLILGCPVVEGRSRAEVLEFYRAIPRVCRDYMKKG